MPWDCLERSHRVGQPPSMTPFLSGQALIWGVSCSGCAHHRGLMAGWPQGCPAAGPSLHRCICRCLSPLAWHVHAADGNAASPSHGDSCPGMSLPCGSRSCSRPCRWQFCGTLAQSRSLLSSSDGFTPANKL